VSNAQHREIFYAFHGPGPYACYLCKEKVLAWWDRDPDTERAKIALAVHHISGDHSDNNPENLAAAHYGCHGKLHRMARPLVRKGDKLPERWKARIAASSTKRAAEMSEEDKAAWLVRVREGFQKVDKTPLTCPKCGAGPFKGQHGLGIHTARTACGT
jgi:ribosomal protein S27AE